MAWKRLIAVTVFGTTINYATAGAYSLDCHAVSLNPISASNRFSSYIICCYDPTTNKTTCEDTTDFTAKTCTVTGQASCQPN